jgi:5-methylcytosine-specific restriction endonuclease McrA
MIRRWSARCDACRDCETSTASHYGIGLCRTCYGARKRAGTLDGGAGSPKRWSIYCDACLSCGTTELRHAADGLCLQCYEASPARALTYQRYRKTEGRRKSRKAWANRNQEAEAKKSRRRTRRRRGAGYNVVDDLPPLVEEIVLEEFGRRCVLCGARDQLCLDHHEPLQDGHPLLDNAVVLCLECNSAKGTRHPDEFYDRGTRQLIKSALAWCRARRLVLSYSGSAVVS